MKFTPGATLTPARREVERTHYQRTESRYIMESSERGHIIEGEAPESDAEEEDVRVQRPSNLRLIGESPLTRGGGCVSVSEIHGEDEELSDANHHLSSSHHHLSSPDHIAQSTSPTSPSSSLNNPPLYNTLLHKKLREANSKLNNDVVTLYTKELEVAGKNLKLTGQQLNRAKQTMQETCNTMRLITNALFHLEDKINIVASCTILPDIHIPSQPAAATAINAAVCSS